MIDLEAASNWILALALGIWKSLNDRRDIAVEGKSRQNLDRTYICLTLDFVDDQSATPVVSPSLLDIENHEPVIAVRRLGHKRVLSKEKRAATFTYPMPFDLFFTIQLAQKSKVNGNQVLWRAWRVERLVARATSIPHFSNDITYCYRSIIFSS